MTNSFKPSLFKIALRLLLCQVLFPSQTYKRFFSTDTCFLSGLPVHGLLAFTVTVKLSLQKFVWTLEGFLINCRIVYSD